MCLARSDLAQEPSLLATRCLGTRPHECPRRWWPEPLSSPVHGSLAGCPPSFHARPRLPELSPPPCLDKFLLAPALASPRAPMPSRGPHRRVRLLLRPREGASAALGPGGQARARARARARGVWTPGPRRPAPRKSQTGSGAPAGRAGALRPCTLAPTAIGALAVTPHPLALVWGRGFRLLHPPTRQRRPPAGRGKLRRRVAPALRAVAGGARGRVGRPWNSARGKRE